MSTKETLKITTENLKAVLNSLTEEIQRRPYISVVNEKIDFVEFYISTDQFTLTLIRIKQELFAYTHKIEINKTDLNDKAKWVYQPGLDIKIYSNGSSYFNKEQSFTRKASIGETLVSFQKIEDFGKDYLDVLESII